MKLLIIDMHDIYTTWIIKNFVLFQIVTGRWYRHSYIFFLLLHFHKGIEFCLQFFVYPNFSLDFLCTDFCSNTPTTTASLEQHSWIHMRIHIFASKPLSHANKNRFFSHVLILNLLMSVLLSRHYNFARYYLIPLHMYMYEYWLFSCDNIFMYSETI